MTKARKLGILFLAALLLLTSIPAFALGGGLVLGNEPINSLNGGMFVQDSDTFYWTDPRGVWMDNTQLTNEAGRNLNLIGNGLYYTLAGAETRIRRHDLRTGSTETVLTWDAPISQLYITGDGRALLLSTGNVYRVTLSNGSVTRDDTSFFVTGFIPTVHGTVYASGTLGNYTLHANGRVIETGVTQFFTEDSDLIIRRGTADFQVSLASLFNGGQINIMAYVPRGDSLQLQTQSQHIGCEVCENFEDMMIALEAEGAPIYLQTQIATQSLPLTQSQRNAVLRARQMREIRWTPLQDIIGWRGNSTYRAGNTYTGIPYAQPINAGRYVPWQASLEHFASAVQDINSNMYTSFSFIGSHATRAPFYGTDCSGFVSWALAHPVRTHTGTFPNHATRITQNINAVQVGDVFNSAGHNLMVTAVEFDAEGNLAAVETMEQTIPLPRHRRYGAGGCSGGIQALVNRTFGGGFALYRSNTIGNIPFTPSPAVDVEDGHNYTITATAGPGGVISPAGVLSVPAGSNQTFVFNPHQGFAVSRVVVNGVNVGTPANFTKQNVTANSTIHVEFVLTGSPFSDVGPSNWFYDAVVYVFREGFMTGTSPTEFAPLMTTTRGMFVTILGRIAGVEASDWSFDGTVTGSIVNIRSGPSTGHSIITQVNQGTRVSIIGSYGDWYRIRHAGQNAYISRPLVASQRGTFSDVAPGAFYAPFVEWANYRGIVTGYEGQFNPRQTMNRQEMATMLHRYITAMGIHLPQTNRPAFHDLDQIAYWARPAVVALQRAGILQGTGEGYFEPQGTSNRASVATMIRNFHQQHG